MKLVKYSLCCECNFFYLELINVRLSELPICINHLKSCNTCEIFTSCSSFDIFWKCVIVYTYMQVVYLQVGTDTIIFDWRDCY